jgi:hypothetical protein
VKREVRSKEDIVLSNNVEEDDGRCRGVPGEGGHTQVRGSIHLIKKSIMDRLI